MRVYIKRCDCDFMLRFIVDPPVLCIGAAHQESAALNERISIIHGFISGLLLGLTARKCLLRTFGFTVFPALFLRCAPVRVSEGRGFPCG